MGGCALKLIVQRAALVQNAIENVGGYSARGEAGYLGRRNKTR